MNLVEFCNYCPNCPDAWEIYVKAKRYLEQYERPACFISGGADSDVMLDIIYHADNDKKVRYVYFDTGLEMDATKRHIKYLEEKYGIKVETVRPKVPIPLAVKKYGMPVFNKVISNRLYRLQKHNFDFSSDKSLNEYLDEYGKTKLALRWWTNDFNGTLNNIKNKSYLKEFMQHESPPILFSDNCCLYAKKNVAKDFDKANNIDLAIIGVRKAEGGARASAYESCFSEHTHNGLAEFRPLFWMTNEQRRQYEADTGIIHSDAYTVYGCKRTGCAGCPFGRNWQEELKMLEQYEPKLYKACMSIFGEAYNYMNRFEQFRAEEKKKAKEQSI